MNGQTTTAGEEDFIVIVKLMKLTGLYQLLDQDAPRRWGFNLYRAAALVEIVSGVVSVTVLLASSLFYSHDTNELMNYIMLVVAVFFSTFKLTWMYRNARSTWNCLDITSRHFLSHGRSDWNAFRRARARSFSASTVFAVLWSSVTVAWCLSPFVVDDLYTVVRFDEGVRRFRFNSLNYVYPIDEQFYNEHFLWFYVPEMLAVVFWGHVTIAYDTFVISICIAIQYQLRMIADSYDALRPGACAGGTYNCPAGHAPRRALPSVLCTVQFIPV